MTANNKPSGSVPIGTPITGTQVHILDEDLRPVAVGETGELYASGDGVALGYLAGDPERAFFREARIAPGLLYRTGDLVRQSSTGAIEFVGRRDTLVKIRGYRISLEEIRQRTAELEGVDDAIVTRKVLDSGDQLLVAYVRPQANLPLRAAHIRQRLAEVLPRYMIPDQVIVKAELPITQSGKLDRQAVLR